MNDRHRDDRRASDAARGWRSRAELLVTALTIVLGFVGLIWFSANVVRPQPHPSDEPRRGERDLVHSEAERIFVPAALRDLAKDSTVFAALESHASIQRCLRERGLERVWYAVTYRQLQANDLVETMTTHSRPAVSSANVQEFRSVLETLAGKPPSTPMVDYSTAEITIIPEAIAAKEPGDAMAELMLIPR